MKPKTSAEIAGRSYTNGANPFGMSGNQEDRTNKFTPIDSCNKQITSLSSNITMNQDFPKSFNDSTALKKYDILPNSSMNTVFDKEIKFMCNKKPTISNNIPSNSENVSQFIRLVPDQSFTSLNTSINSSYIHKKSLLWENKSYPSVKSGFDSDKTSVTNSVSLTSLSKKGVNEMKNNLLCSRKTLTQFKSSSTAITAFEKKMNGLKSHITSCSMNNDDNTNYILTSLQPRSGRKRDEQSVSISIQPSPITADVKVLDSSSGSCKVVIKPLLTSTLSSNSSSKDGEVRNSGINRSGRRLYMGDNLLSSWLRGNRVADEDSLVVGDRNFPITNEVDAISTIPIMKDKTGRKVEENDRWNFTRRKTCNEVRKCSYDDKHYGHKKNSDMNKLPNCRITTISEYNINHASDDIHSIYDKERIRNQNYHGGDSSILSFKHNCQSPMLRKKTQLQSIAEAVCNLDFPEFERMAEDRAINIVGTWLSNGGFIDGLLERNSNNYMLAVDESTSSSVCSIVPSESAEINAKSFSELNVIEEKLKIDKELIRLREGVLAELSLVDARLNDGVGASNSEVRDLVSAISNIRTDLGKLKELNLYTNGRVNTSRKDDDNEFKLTEYPRLKGTINARGNLVRCFRELEFFALIPFTCDRLREELHQGEWTEYEYASIRNVCMEHVQLEILLVEAEAGMKNKINVHDHDTPGNPAISGGNHQMVDNFLSQHVKNVWELGEEIRMRILSGIGSSFDLALQNPMGMVALVEAVEVYERAASQYEALNGRREENKGKPNKNRLQFTNMRAAALTTLFHDFELRGLEVFRTVHMQTTESMDNGDDVLNIQFSGVLRAATELVTEIDVVKNQMAPCFAPHWHVEMLWSCCVAHVCSNQIIQHIGGPEGNNLPDLTVTQLLDLIAWVEFFRESIEDAFPSISSIQAKKTYFDTKPDLFSGNQNKEVNMVTGIDSLAWINNMLWEVHMRAQDEFLSRTRCQIEEWLSKIYNNELEGHQTSEGRLSTTLCEDIFELASVQLRTIRERLSRKSEVLVMAVCLILSQLKLKQINHRDTFLKDLETCCAAANDFQRMSEKTEDILQELIKECDFSDRSESTIEECSNELLVLYSGDAVFAAQMAHVFVFNDIENNITDLFEQEWEINLTHNERAITLSQTLEDFMGDLEQFLDDFMLKKTVDALIASSVLFYTRCLLLKVERHNTNRVSWFNDNKTALERMDGDIRILREYFEGFIEGMPALAKVIEAEFEFLTTVHELLRIAAGFSESDASDFILVAYKKIKDVDIMKHLVGDLWHLVQPTQERMIWELVESLEETLVTICPPDDFDEFDSHDRMSVPGLRLDVMLSKLYIRSKRKRPVKSGSMEKLVKKWVIDDTK